MKKLLKLKIIAIRHLEMNQISVLNNPQLHDQKLLKL